MRIHITYIAILIVFATQAQEIGKLNIEGYYEGAIIKGNSITLLTAELYEAGDSLILESNIKEWTYYSPLKSNVTRNGNVLKFRTYLGEVTAVIDTAYLEIVGTITSATPAMNIHLKRVRRPPSPKLELEPFTINSSGHPINGTVISPIGLQDKLACAIYVVGRSCQGQNRSLQRAKELAKYGMTTIVFDKRGSKESGFECDQTTLEMHARDLTKVIDFASKLDKVDNAKIGLIAGSYGGWVASRASGISDKISFIATTVGASTSIKDQQLDNAVYYTRELLGGDEEIINQIQTYTLLEYDSIRDKAVVFDEMMTLLELAEENKWKRILSKTDIPSSPDDLDNLWVRRNQYDPYEDLLSFKGPYLSVLAERDRVVPPKENSERLIEIFEKAGKSNYRIVVIPEAPHRMEHGNKVIDLGRIRELRSNAYYFKFDRVVPGAMDEIINFLRDYGYLN